AGRDAGFDARRIQFVSGDLLTDKAVVRLIAIKGLDHVVAIPPDVGADFVSLEAVGVGVTRDVEPFTSPAFAIVWRSEQPVNDGRKGVGSVVGQKRPGPFGSGRKSDQVDAG